MRDLDEIVELEAEHTGLDFKEVQYLKPTHEEFLRDVFSMANADYDGERLIVTGVRDKPGEDRQFGLKEPLVEQAIYQQLVRENIEPDLEVTYTAHQYPPINPRATLGILRVIASRDSQPYMMKKEFGRLKKGEGLIRKGTHKCRLERNDIERMYAARADAAAFMGEVFVSFAGSGGLQTVGLPAVGTHELPSDRAAHRIRGILEDRKKVKPSNMMDFMADLQGLPSLTIALPFASTPYEDRSTQELEKDLAELPESYRDDDLYELCEVLAAKVNFEIDNRGDCYIEDASMQVTIPTPDHLVLVVDSPIDKPTASWVLPEPNYHRLAYPHVEQHDEECVVTSTVGDLKHGLPERAFGTELRVVLANDLVGTLIPLEVKIYGKNLKQPIATTLYVDVVAPS